MIDDKVSKNTGTHPCVVVVIRFAAAIERGEEWTSFQGECIRQARQYAAVLDKYTDGMRQDPEFAARDSECNRQARR